MTCSYLLFCAAAHIRTRTRRDCALSQSPLVENGSSIFPGTNPATLNDEGRLKRHSCHITRTSIYGLHLKLMDARQNGTENNPPIPQISSEFMKQNGFHLSNPSLSPVIYKKEVRSKFKLFSYLAYYTGAALSS